LGGKIFINYRRGDDAGFTGRLFDRLETHFSNEKLFIDVDSIAPGLDFVRVLDEQVAQCDVLLAVIGAAWLGARDENGARRLDNPKDFVRIEIESALQRGVRVIPVLVSNAEMPREHELPETLKPLARRNAVRLTHDRFRADCAGLIKALEAALEEESKRRSEEERNAAKAAHESAEQEKERLKQAALAGLSSEQIAKAEELANWDFIKESRSAKEIRDHLARFPKGITARMARAKLEDIIYATLEPTPKLEALEAFLATFPDGKHASAIVARRDALLRAAAKRKPRKALSAPATLGLSWPGATAWAFLFILAVPLFQFTLEALFTAKQWNWLNEASSMVETFSSATGLSVTMVIVLLLAATISLARYNSLSGTELSLYWLGCVLASFPALVSVFNAFEWNLIGLSLHDEGNRRTTGALFALAATLGSAAVLVYARRDRLSAAEIGNYWLGCALGAATTCAMMFGVNQWDWLGAPFHDAAGGATGCLVAFVIALGSVAIMVRWRGTVLSGAEVGSYWLGCAVIATFAIFTVFGSEGWNWIGAEDRFTGAGATGVLVALPIVFSSALLLGYARRASVDSSEVLRYWLGCAGSAVVALGYWFQAKGWDWVSSPDFGGFLTGALIAALLSLAAGAGLATWWHQFSADHRLRPA
jgi:hypothetical protein